MRAPAVRPRSAFVLLFVVLVGFLAATYTFRQITDTELNSFQTRALVLHGDIDLDRYPRFNDTEYFARERGSHLYSIYGVGVSLVAAPIFAVLTRMGASTSLLQASVAIPSVAAAIILMYVLLSRLVERRLAIAGAIVFGFGTTMWPLASMAMYQHAPVAMFQLIGLIALFSEKPRAPAVAGLAFASSTFIRPTTGITFAFVGLYYLVRGKRPVGYFTLGSVAPLAGMLIQNRWIWGSWLTGGYAHSGIAFDAEMPSALFGLSFGWWRGMFVYSPVLILGFVGAVMALRRLRSPVEQRLVVLALSAIATFLFYSKWSTWWNGLNQFGYRYLLDIVPLLVVLAAYAVSRSERVRTIAMPLAALSIMTMTFGAGPHKFGFDGVLYADTLEESSLGQSWIVFLDQPLNSLLRLGGVAGVCALFAWLTKGIQAQTGTPLFGSTPALAADPVSGRQETEKPAARL
ncbi:MAG: hypothetical protein WEB06_08900 [Actinomycetota bacterium]